MRRSDPPAKLLHPAGQGYAHGLRRTRPVEDFLYVFQAGAVNGPDACRQRTRCQSQAPSARRAAREIDVTGMRPAGVRRRLTRVARWVSPSSLMITGRDPPASPSACQPRCARLNR
jgi:hypothetical protein